MTTICPLIHHILQIKSPNLKKLLGSNNNRSRPLIVNTLFREGYILCSHLPNVATNSQSRPTWPLAWSSFMIWAIENSKDAWESGGIEKVLLEVTAMFLKKTCRDSTIIMCSNFAFWIEITSPQDDDGKGIVSTRYSKPPCLLIKNVGGYVLLRWCLLTFLRLYQQTKDALQWL